MQPIVLGPNQPDTFYRGGGRIARFRGADTVGPTADPERPEDWIASTTSRYGGAGTAANWPPGTVCSS